jgi:SAM-dependent MidA family methyltransferase
MREPTVASERFQSAFRARAGSGELRFDEFVQLALFDPEVGYYRRDQRRIGTATGTDFFTATSTGPVFGELVVEACSTLLAGEALDRFEFIEIGAESTEGALAGVKSPFKSNRTIRVSEPWSLEGECIVFSNELFDAQPFRRFVKRDDGWAELGVSLRSDGHLIETSSTISPPPFLPLSPPTGYTIDAPLAAVQLLEEIVNLPWRGLFVACDYGKSWQELSEACPAGTARAYFRHTQSNDLLAHPGEQDLTCHICWDWMLEALQKSGFTSAETESQESFFIHRAQKRIAEISAAEAHRFSPRKNALMQLLHPSQFGQKFQVLHGLRR